VLQERPDRLVNVPRLYLAPPRLLRGAECEPVELVIHILLRELQHHTAEVLLEQRLRRTLCDDLSVVHDRDLVAERVGLVHVVRGQNDRLVPGFDKIDEVPEIPSRLGVEAGRGLVEEEHFRIIDNGEGHQEPLTLAAGKFSRVPIEELIKAAQADDLLRVHGMGIKVLEQPQCLAHGQEFLQRRDLELDAGFFPERGADGCAFVERGAGIALLDTFDDLNERGLARAVRSEQTEADALLDRKADIIHGTHARVGFDEIVDFDHRCHSMKSTMQCSGCQAADRNVRNYDYDMRSVLRSGKAGKIINAV
jgi:hypothetical protein